MHLMTTSATGGSSNGSPVSAPACSAVVQLESSLAAASTAKTAHRCEVCSADAILNIHRAASTAANEMNRNVPDQRDNLRWLTGGDGVSSKRCIW